MDLETTPGMTPPDGETSDFDAPYNSLQIGIVVAFGISYFLATLFLGLRYFQSFKLVKKLEIDLIIVTISYGVSLVYFVTMVHLMEFGWGKHLWDVSLADLVKFNKALLPNTLTYLMCPSITKMAMLEVLFLINPSKIYRISVIAVAVAVFSYTLTLCIITGGPCNPLKSGTTKCLENVALSHAVLNIVSDFAVVALPIPTINNLNLSLKQKASVGCILALGSGVVICSIARLPYVIVLDSTEDVTYTEAILGVWSIVEINLGIVCACAMRLKKFFSTYLPQLGLFSSRSRGTGSNPWGGARTDKSTQRSYQLHSIQKSCAEPISETSTSKVYSSFKRDAEIGREDTGSTDKILAPRVAQVY